MTLRDVVARLEHISATAHVWVTCEICKEEAQADYTEIQTELSALRLDIERYLLKTEGRL